MASANDPDRPPTRFGPFEICIERRELRRDGRLVEIGERAFALLLALLHRAGQPVSKEELTRQVWRGRAVEASNLTVQVATLRRLLADRRDTEAEAQRFIRTVPGYGYAFAALVEHEAGAAAQPAASPGPAPPGLADPTEPLTQFIGREQERAELQRLLAANRLVTLVGIGGVGKTRLALRLRPQLAPAFPDGVSFVDLAHLLDPGQVKEAVAASVGAGGGGTSAEAALVAALHARRHLLIVDNAEHLTAAVRQLLALILARCPGVCALVTSRESLGFPGEAIFRLAPLDLPPASDGLTAAGALDYEAVQLFADRARALLPGFAVDDANAPSIAAICRRLDGIALAIEMAVPRLEILSVPQLLERLDDRFRAVSGLRHDVPARQRTLRAMFDWSWDLLSVRERRLLQHLAVFAAGATLGSVEALAAAEDAPGGVLASDIIEHLAGLAQKSLVVAIEPVRGDGTERRYRLLETTRQYALDHLGPADRSALSRLHALHMAALFERAEVAWPTLHSAVWLGRYGPDADNLRAAMQWAFDTPGETELALRLVAASSPLWWELPGLPLREGRQWYALSLQRIGPQTPAGVQARLWLGQSWTDTMDGDLENYPASNRAARLFREAGETVGLGAALWRASGTVIYREHQPSAADLLDGAFAALGSTPATKWLALCHIRRADLLLQQDELCSALAEYDRALRMVRETGHNYGLIVCGGNRAYLLFKLGLPGEAVSALRSLQAELPVGLRRPLDSLLATLLAATGQHAEAFAAIVESLRGTLSLGMTATLGRSLEVLALLLAHRGECRSAARLLGYVLTLHSPGRARVGPRQIVFERLNALIGTGVAAEELRVLMAEGAGWTEAEATEAATRMCQGQE